MGPGNHAAPGCSCQLFPSEGGAEFSRAARRDGCVRAGRASGLPRRRRGPGAPARRSSTVLTASSRKWRWKEDYESSDVPARRVADALGCAHLIRRRFEHPVEGERKRGPDRRALMPDPELLLLDEPAAGRTSVAARSGAPGGHLGRDPRAPTMVMVTTTWKRCGGITHGICCPGTVLARTAG